MDGPEAFALNNREGDGPALQSSFPDKHTPAGGLHLPGRGGVGRLKLNFQACIHSQHPHGNKLVRGSSARPPGATQLRPPRRAVLMGYPALLPYPSSQAFPSDRHPLQPIPWCTEPRRQRLPTPGPYRHTCVQTYIHTHTPIWLSHIHMSFSLTHIHTSLSCIYLPLLDLTLPSHTEGPLYVQGEKGASICSHAWTHSQSHRRSYVTHDLAGISGQACTPSTHRGREGPVWEPSSPGRIWLCSRV